MKTSNKVEQTLTHYFMGAYADVSDVKEATKELEALIEAEKALVLERLLEQKKNHAEKHEAEYFDFEYVPTELIQQELDQVTQIIKGVKGIKE